jgi:hypothetical protein
MPTEVESPKPDEIRVQFRELLAKTNKDQPRAADVKALSDFLNGNNLLNCGEMY